jgi:biotin carboxylase
VAGDPRGRAAKRLLVLGAGPAQLGLLEAAQARGLFVIAVDRNPAAPGFAFADRRAIVSTEDDVAVERLAVAESIDGVVSPGADWPVAIAARVASRLALPHPISPEVAQTAVSKVRQRERFDTARVPQPRWTLAASLADAAHVAFPAVVKPPDRQGQRGLAVATSKEELARAIGEALVLSRSGSVIVEELVDGPEVTVNAFSVDGEFVPLAVTDRVLADAPAFGVALAHVWPSEHEVDAAVAAAEAAVRALGIRNGPTYTQLRLAADGPRVGEVAARVGGGHDAELCHAALGVDVNALTVAAALGEETPLPRPDPQVGGACVRFAVPPEGELLAIEGVEEAEALPGVEWVRLYRRPGHVFGPLRIGPDRAGAVLAVGASRDEAVERASAAVDSLRLVTSRVETLTHP